MHNELYTGRLKIIIKNVIQKKNNNQAMFLFRITNKVLVVIKVFFKQTLFVYVWSCKFENKQAFP